LAYFFVFDLVYKIQMTSLRGSKLLSGNQTCDIQTDRQMYRGNT